MKGALKGAFQEALKEAHPDPLREVLKKAVKGELKCSFDGWKDARSPRWRAPESACPEESLWPASCSPEFLQDRCWQPAVESRPSSVCRTRCGLDKFLPPGRILMAFG